MPVKSADAKVALLDHIAPKVRLRRNARGAGLPHPAADADR
jgi:hypothetical protein